MELISWTDEMSVNINEIDEQHKKLIELINNLFNAMLEGKAQDIINKTIDELINYANYHFSTEENYFEKHNYPGFHSHKIQHSFYKDEILQFIQGDDKNIPKTHLGPEDKDGKNIQIPNTHSEPEDKDMIILE